MNTFSTHIGNRIKFFRKKQGMTIEDLATEIHKSKSAVSKYENGQISIDVETLKDIADVLNVQVYQLTYNEPPKQRHLKLDELNNSRLLQGVSQLYTYNYNNKSKKIIKNLLKIIHDEVNNEIRACYFYDVSDFDSYLESSWYYTGSIVSYDLLTYFLLENQTNPIERIYMCVHNPLSTRTYAHGLVTGIVAESYAPLAMRVLVSKTPITDQDFLIDMLKISKEDIKYIKDTNWLIIHNV